MWEVQVKSKMTDTCKLVRLHTSYMYAFKIWIIESQQAVHITVYYTYTYTVSSGVKKGYLGIINNYFFEIEVNSG